MSPDDRRQRNIEAATQTTRHVNDAVCKDDHICACLTLLTWPLILLTRFTTLIRFQSAERVLAQPRQHKLRSFTYYLPVDHKLLKKKKHT